MATIRYNQVKPETFENPIFSIHLKYMRFYGLIIGTNQSYHLWHLIRCTFFTICFVVVVILNFARIFQAINILEADFMLRLASLTNLSFGIHVVNAYFQRERIARLVKFLHDDLLYIRSRSDSLEEQLFRKTVKFVRRITYMLVIPIAGSSLQSCLLSLVLTILYPDIVFDQVFFTQKVNSTMKPVTLFVAFPFGAFTDNFVIAYMGPYFSCLLNSFTLPLLHTFSIGVLHYLIFKIEIISRRMSEMDLTKLTPCFKKEIDQLNENEKNLMRLKMCEYCVEEQNKIRWFVQELEQLVRIPLFMDFFILSFLLCVLLYIFVMGSLSNEEYMSATIIISTMTGLQGLYHWHANILTKTHEDMGDAIYSCDWYNYSLKVQKSVHIIMINTMQPLVIKALNIELKVATLVDIFQGAFSYFSFLRNIKHH